MDMNGKEYLARMAELFDLPADVAAGLSHMELLGDRQLLLEGHEGLLAYGTELIDVSVGGAVLRVTGEGLTLKSMTEREVRIGGRIDGVEFLREGGGSGPWIVRPDCCAARCACGSLGKRGGV